MTTHEYNGKEYLHVTWVRHNMCHGCEFQHKQPCPNNDKAYPKYIGQCNNNNGTLYGRVWVENTPEAIAKYMAERLT